LLVKYTGTGSGVTIPGIGEVKPGDVVDTPEEIGLQLIQRPDFERVDKTFSTSEETSYVSSSAEYTSVSSSTDITVTTTVTDQTEQTEEVKEE